MVSLDDVRKLALTLPRTTEGVVRERVRFRIGRIVYLGFSDDEALMGFAFPKEEREALVASESDRIHASPHPPHLSLLDPFAHQDLRYNWCVVRLDAIDATEMAELVLDAWRMCVPEKVATEQRGD